MASLLRLDLQSGAAQGEGDTGGDAEEIALVTVHPLYLLRLVDADVRALEYKRFVDDLKVAAALLRKSAHAA